MVMSAVGKPIFCKVPGVDPSEVEKGSALIVEVT